MMVMFGRRSVDWSLSRDRTRITVNQYVEPASESNRESNVYTLSFRPIYLEERSRIATLILIGHHLYVISILYFFFTCCPAAATDSRCVESYLRCDIFCLMTFRSTKILLRWIIIIDQTLFPGLLLSPAIAITLSALWQCIDTFKQHSWQTWLLTTSTPRIGSSKVKQWTINNFSVKFRQWNRYKSHPIGRIFYVLPYSSFVAIVHRTFATCPVYWSVRDCCAMCSCAPCPGAQQRRILQ